MLVSITATAQIDEELKSDNAFLVSTELISIPEELIGTWEMTDGNLKEENDLNIKDYVIIRPFGSKNFIMQVYEKNYSNEIKVTLYKGSISVIGDNRFVNLKEISLPKSDEYAEEEQSEDDEYYAIYNHYMLTLDGNKFKFTDFVSNARKYNSQNAYTQFVKLNMENSFFYKHKYATFSDKIFEKR
jgi:hypothetical protein